MYSISIRNMTQVGSTEIIVYSDEAADPAYKIESATLKMGEGSAGSLTIKVPVGNAGYDYFEELSTQVIVRKNTVTNNADKIYWIGRLLKVKIDFDNSKELEFEGIFNYLIDTIQLPSKSTCSLTEWVTFLLNNHNSICTASGEHYKKVYKGTFDTLIDQTSHELYTDYETTQEMINNAIAYDEAHVFFRYVWDSTYGCYNLYLDFKKDYDGSGNVPVISFGQNLMDYSRTYEPEELATVIIPRGERYTDEEWTNVTTGQNPTEDSSAPSELEHYRTVWSKPTTTDHTLHDYRVYTLDTDALNRFGYVCKTIDFDGVRDYTTLLQLAQNYLANQKWVKLTIDISAVDMKLLSPGINIDNISVGRMIHCISAPHGLNYYYPCTEISEDILDLSLSTYTLGTGDVKYLSDARRDTDDKLKEIVRRNINREQILTDNILNKPTSDFTHIYESIDAVETLSEEGLVTVRDDAKSNVLNLLNIFDAEFNPNKKGYVHFLREHADYSIDDSKMTLDKLKARVMKYTPSNKVDQVNTFFTHCKNVMTGTNDDNLVITVVLGPEDYQTKISTTRLIRGSVNNKKVGYFRSDLNNYFINYNANILMYRAYLNMNGPNSMTVSNSNSSTIQYLNKDSTDFSGTAASYMARANKATLDVNGNTYQVYVSTDVYTDSTCTTRYWQQNLFAESKKTAISFGDLKTRINKYFPDTITSNSITLSTFFSFLKSYMDDEDFMVVVLYGPEEYQTCIGLVGRCKGTINNEKVPYLGSPVDTRYTGTTQYFAGADYTFAYKAYFQTVSPNNYIFNINTNDWWSYWFSSNTAECKLATPAFGNSIQSPYCPLPNKPTIDSTNYTFFTNKNIYTADLSDVYKNQNLYNQDEPYLNEQDHIYEIVISNNKDYMNSASTNWCWRWNQYGLYALQGGYSDSVLPDGTYQDANDRVRLALTYDGNIVANRITAGILNADVIRAGVIRSRQVGATVDDDNLAIDIPNGNIIAKKGTLIFNTMRTISTTSAGIITVPLNEFIYISNVNCTNSAGVPILMSVGGADKNDWRIVSGDSFGVDSAGRVYMREGIIGATGGLFSIVARNVTYCRSLWMTDEYVWSVSFNTDAARPYVSTDNEEYYFRFRLAHYDANNDYVFVTKLYSFRFEAGSDDQIYQYYPFYPTITPDEQHTPPFAEGELFPVFYTLRDDATEDYYEQDGHRYVIINGQTIVATETDPNKYTTYSGLRSGSAGSNAGAVNIGSGYLSNGTFGQNQSFYLGGLKRSGTVAENTRSDWRFTVGSKFGVTENGNVYCTDMYARGAYLDRCTVNGRITVTSVTNLNLTSSNLVDGSSKTCDLHWAMYLNAATHGSGMFEDDTEFDMWVDPNSELSAPSVSPKFKFTVIMPEYESSGHGGADKQVGTFEFTYNKNSASTSTPQYKIIDTSSWNNADPGYTPDRIDGYVVLNVMVEMLTEETSSFVFIGASQLKAYPSQDTAGSDPYAYIEGIVTVARVESTPRPAVQCAVDFIGGSNKWLGGPRLPWAKVYCTELYDNVSSSGSSRLYKDDISILDSKYDELFDRLKPVKYKFRENYFNDNKFHTGFIMEDIGDSMKDLGIEDKEFAAYNPDYDNGGGSLRYNEFIALTVSQVQKLKRRVQELEKQLYEQGIIDDTDG